MTLTRSPWPAAAALLGLTLARRAIRYIRSHGYGLKDWRAIGAQLQERIPHAGYQVT